MQESIIKFLKSHPLISISQLEKECGMSQGSIHKAIKGVRNIPEKHITKVLNTLARYGYGAKPRIYFSVFDRPHNFDFSKSVIHGPSLETPITKTRELHPGPEKTITTKDPETL